MRVVRASPKTDLFVQFMDFLNYCRQRILLFLRNIAFPAPPGIFPEIIAEYTNPGDLLYMCRVIDVPVKINIGGILVKGRRRWLVACNDKLHSSGFGEHWMLFNNLNYFLKGGKRLRFKINEQNNFTRTVLLLKKSILQRLYIILLKEKRSFNNIAGT